MIALYILIIASFLSITWGIYLVGEIRLYVTAREQRGRREAVVALRRVVVALCLWLFVFSFVFRTFCVLVGVGDEIAAQVTFYALLGTNLTGSLFASVSLWFD